MDTNRTYNVLVIGGGAREHALCRVISKSEQCGALYCAPGNPGIEEMGIETIPQLPITNHEMVTNYCHNYGIDLVVIGPEAPLDAGLADDLRKAGFLVFGPGADGAQIESSKAWAKGVMIDAEIPTANHQLFTNVEAAVAYAREKFSQGNPQVVKANGLCAGKGVVVPRNADEAEKAIREIMGGKFGQPGLSVVIEDFMEGVELSIIAITDGTFVFPLEEARDHKRLRSGEQGPNTGGMGAYSPVPDMTADVARQVMSILRKLLHELRKQGIEYRGVIYAGLMLCTDGVVRVIEFNCRFGDPETQVVLARLKSDLLPMLIAAAEGDMSEAEEPEWDEEVAVCVVLAAHGYPDSPRKGDVITGIDKACDDPNVTVLHAGTKEGRGSLFFTSGGRVLTVVARGRTMSEARATAYAAVDKIQFADMQYRDDIGLPA